MKNSPGEQDTSDRIRVVCEVFERLLQAGREPQIEDYVATAAPGDHNALFEVLLKTEVSYRRGKEQRPKASDYVDRFEPQSELVHKVLRQVESERTADAKQPALEETVVQGDPVRPAIHGPAIDRISSLGRYEMREVLGEGGFGTVYRAWDGELGREVAIKVLHGNLPAKAQDARRFVQEAQTAAKLNHPDICPVYDMGELDGTQFIVMGLVKGKSLQEFLESGKAISPRQAVHAVYKLTSALTEAHRQGIVHRDLKPANIMLVAKRNQLVILDFGLARQLNAKGARLTLSGQLLGTPLYMAPEQVRADIEHVGPRSDIYSLGVILYRMLAGRGPFTGSVAEVFAQILYEEPAPPSAYHANLSPELDAICLKAIAKDADQRYQTMTEFGIALSDFLKGKTRSTALQAAPAANKPDGATKPASADRSNGADQTDSAGQPDSADQPDSGLELDWLTMPEMAVAPRLAATALPISPAPARLPAAAVPRDAACPKCAAPLRGGAKLCTACGFHQGLNQQFDVIAEQNSASEPSRKGWLAEQLGEGETPEGLALAVACIVPLVALIFMGLLYGLFGPWAFLGVGLAMVALIPVLAMVAGWRLGPASMYLYYCRLRRWRTIWQPGKQRNVLDLRHSLTSDADLRSLKEKWQIEVLDLENTQVTDAGIEPLARLESLRFLVLRRTKVSAEGLARLRQLMPKTRIWS